MRLDMAAGVIHRGQKDNRERGVSMVELLIAVLIMIPVLMGILSLYFKNVKGVTESWETTHGTAVGQRLLSHMRRLRLDE